MNYRQRLWVCIRWQFRPAMYRKFIFPAEWSWIRDLLLDAAEMLLQAAYLALQVITWPIRVPWSLAVCFIWARRKHAEGIEKLKIVLDDPAIPHRVNGVRH